MKYLTRLLKSHITYFIVLTLIVFALNLTPLITHIRRSPPGRTFAMIHNNAQDYFFYLSLMNQGGNGAWLTKDPYTAEPHQPSLIFAYFLWIGKLAKLFHIPYPIMYHFIRILFGFLLILNSYFLILKLRIPYPRLTFFFFLFASPFMHRDYVYGKLTQVPFMYWWTGIDAIRRTAYLPHHMIGGLLLVTTILLVIKWFETNKKKYIIISILLSLPLAFIHTPSLFIILLILPPTVIIYLISGINHPWGGPERPRACRGGVEWDSPGVREIIGLLVYWFIGLFLLWLMISQTGRGFPWSQYADWEKRLQFPLTKELLGALGILSPLAASGLFSSLLSGKFHRILIACWLIVPFIIIPVAPYLGISNIRLIQGVPYLPLAILACFGISTIQKAVNHPWGGPERPRACRGGVEWDSPGVREIIGLLVIIGLFLFFTVPTLSWSFRDQIREYWPIYGNIHFDNRLFKAFDFINYSFPKKTVNLGTFYTGNYLPAYTSTVSYLGHFGYTQKVEEKEKLVNEFFTGKMSQQESQEFLQKNNIGLIFQGPEEKPGFQGKLYPDILTPVYDTEEVTIYKPNF